MSVKRILVPLDLSPLGEAKLPVAEDQARAFGAELLLLHVVPPSAMDPSGAVSHEEARARSYLDTVAGRMHADGLQANYIVRAGPAAGTIVEEAREREVDLIVLGSNVRAGLPRAILGNVADEVVRTAPCPVLLVRPRLEAGTATPVRSFDEDAERTGPLARRSLGSRTVEVTRIIGSVGRASSLGPNFRPLQRTREDDQRYERIRRALDNGQPLPPIELYKLGFGYYVLDGNHRVAAALELGQEEIDAEVTEFVPLGDTAAQRAFTERRTFERATGLTRIEAANSESYPELQRFIKEYAVSNGIDDLRLAARRWYTAIFRPLARRIRQLGLARRFPGERSADIAVRVGRFRTEESARQDTEVEWLDALEAFGRENAAPGAARTDPRLRRRRALSLLGRREE